MLVYLWTSQLNFVNMKITNIYMAIAAMAFIAFSSCQKEKIATPASMQEVNYENQKEEISSAPNRSPDVLWSDTYKLISFTNSGYKFYFSWMGSKRQSVFAIDYAWKAVGETNISKYTVMHSNDNSNWAEFPDTVYAIQRDSLNTYKYTRTCPYNSGTAYSKLKIFNNDNTISYSNVVAVSIQK